MQKQIQQLQSQLQRLTSAVNKPKAKKARPKRSRRPRKRNLVQTGNFFVPKTISLGRVVPMRFKSLINISNGQGANGAGSFFQHFILHPAFPITATGLATANPNQTCRLTGAGALLWGQYSHDQPGAAGATWDRVHGYDEWWNFMQYFHLTKASVKIVNTTANLNQQGVVYLAHVEPVRIPNYCLVEPNVGFNDMDLDQARPNNDQESTAHNISSINALIRLYHAKALSSVGLNYKATYMPNKSSSFIPEPFSTGWGAKFDTSLLQGRSKIAENMFPHGAFCVVGDGFGIVAGAQTFTIEYKLYGFGTPTATSGMIIPSGVHKGDLDNSPETRVQFLDLNNTVIRGKGNKVGITQPQRTKFNLK